MLSHNLVSVDCIFPMDYSYCRDDNSAHSWPDHILTFSHYANVIANVSTLNSVDNFSDHLPLSFEINLNLSPSLNVPLSQATTPDPSQVKGPTPTPKVCWSN